MPKSSDVKLIAIFKSSFSSGTNSFVALLAIFYVIEKGDIGIKPKECSTLCVEISNAWKNSFKEGL